MWKVRSAPGAASKKEGDPHTSETFGARPDESVAEFQPSDERQLSGDLFNYR
ncbi:hypothetical protein SAMN06298226_2948 [Nitrosovibrio sp. Nv4]|nr:hypothetical protein SAMN06298226_2948 [Nitrosovibrio sp. Nv4]